VPSEPVPHKDARNLIWHLSRLSSVTPKILSLARTH
jgi:hypothetical protein